MTLPNNRSSPQRCLGVIEAGQAADGGLRVVVLAVQHGAPEEQQLLVLHPQLTVTRAGRREAQLTAQQELSRRLVVALSTNTQHSRISAAAS